MSGNEHRTISYLLRLWPVRTRGGLVWRASLESARMGERWGFANLTDLFAFLEEEVAHVDRDDRHRLQRRNRDGNKHQARKHSTDQF